MKPPSVASAISLSAITINALPLIDVHNAAERASMASAIKNNSGEKRRNCPELDQIFGLHPADQETFFNDPVVQRKFVKGLMQGFIKNEHVISMILNCTPNLHQADQIKILERLHSGWVPHSYKLNNKTAFLSRFFTDPEVQVSLGKTLKKIFSDWTFRLSPTDKSIRINTAIENLPSPFAHEARSDLEAACKGYQDALATLSELNTDPETPTVLSSGDVNVLRTVALGAGHVGYGLAFATIVIPPAIACTILGAVCCPPDSHSSAAIETDDRVNEDPARNIANTGRPSVYHQAAAEIAVHDSGVVNNNSSATIAISVI
jgi:hypothetical protein